MVVVCKIRKNNEMNEHSEVGLIVSAKPLRGCTCGELSINKQTKLYKLRYNAAQSASIVVVQPM